MATGGEEVFISNVNVASVAFRKHYGELVTAIQEPEALAVWLYSSELVTKNLMDEVGWELSHG